MKILNFIITLLATFTLNVASANIPNGIYFIQLSNGFVMEAEGNTYNNNGCKIQNWTNYNGNNQKWAVTKTAAGTYRMRNLGSNKVLDADNYTLNNNGGKVQLWQEISGNRNQEWILTDVGSGRYAIRNAASASNKVLDVTNYAVGTAGTTIQLWDYSTSNTANQIWTFVPAQTMMKVYVTTGGDDLRAGNNAYIKVNYTDNTTSPEYVLSTGMAGGARIMFSKNLDKLIDNVNKIKNIEIRHDGSPRPGNPFDTYDNWNLDKIRVTFMINGTEQEYCAHAGTPIIRFTGAYRIHQFTPQPIVIQQETSTIKVYINTGTGELRGGNYAYITVHYTDGTSSNEMPLGTGYTQNSTASPSIALGKILTSTRQIRSITIRHDGSPRNGHPFDTYGNWTLQSLRVVLLMPDSTEPNIVNLPGNPLIQFNGNVRTVTYNRQ
jgi:hypothetical protein